MIPKNSGTVEVKISFTSIPFSISVSCTETHKISKRTLARVQFIYFFNSKTKNAWVHNNQPISQDLPMIYLQWGFSVHLLFPLY